MYVLFVIQETIFYLCGGSTQRDMTVRSLQKIFHNKLAKKCSWYGRKNNFEIGKLKLIESLKGTYGIFTYYYCVC